MSTPVILDTCCGARMFWFNKQNPLALFCDIRREEMICCDGRHISVDPQHICDFTAMPWADRSFKLVVFDPPHLDRIGDKAYMAQKYGKLPKGWREYLRTGFNECMRVLDDYGVLIFKWSSIQIQLKDVIEALGQEPLFGNRTPSKSKTHWLAFMKLPQMEGV